MNARPAPRSTRLLNRPLRIAVAAVMVMGALMQVLLMHDAHMADRTLDQGVAPLQELLLIQRQASQALQLVQQQDPQQQVRCGEAAQDGMCEVPRLLRNMAASMQRLIDGESAASDLPRLPALEGEARAIALALRDQVKTLLTLVGAQNSNIANNLLAMQRGLQLANQQALELEQQVLAQQHKDFHVEHWITVAVAGALTLATVFALFWMWSRVRTAFIQVKASEARLRAYTDAVPDTAYVLDSHGKVLEIMGQSMMRGDRPMTIPVGAYLQDHRPSDLVNSYLQTIHRALATREVQTLEIELDDVRGEKHWFEGRVAAIEQPVSGLSAHPPAAAEKLGQVIWLSRDVTNRIQTEQALRQLNEELEQRVAERTRELNDAAEELRRFNYTVSHDLRAPLRAVEAYTALAVEEAAGVLSPVAHDLLERSRKSAHQLAQMVESLLNLSRIGEMPLQHSLLDISAMASEICQAFQIDQGLHRLHCQVEPGLTAWADEHLMRSLLQNLISNAVKYSAHREPASIAVGSSVLPDGSVVIQVRDNGAGFDMAQASQLFQPFTRLHSAKDFPGDGIGLATVRRIVMRHGGRIWALGQVDVGATICFTLPAQPPRERDRDFSNSRPAPLDYASSRPAPLWPDIES